MAKTPAARDAQHYRFYEQAFELVLNWRVRDWISVRALADGCTRAIQAVELGAAHANSRVPKLGLEHFARLAGPCPSCSHDGCLREAR